MLSDEYGTLYPFTPSKENEGNTVMLSKEEINAMNLTTEIVSYSNHRLILNEIVMYFQPPLKSIKLEDIINYINSEIIILKIDVEGYECKALQPNVIINKIGKFIPFIFIEWGYLIQNQGLVPGTSGTCLQFREWVQLFYEGGYFPVNPS